jgi:hypothetical protein
MNKYMITERERNGKRKKLGNYARTNYEKIKKRKKGKEIGENVKRFPLT